MKNYEEIINLLCEKFGIALDSMPQLIPQVAKYQIISKSLFIVAFVLIFAITTPFFIRSVKKLLVILKNEENEIYTSNSNVDGNACITIILIYVIIAIVGACTLPFAISDLIGWVCCPTIKFIEYMTDMVITGQ